jgi:hypothetical protein
MHSVLVPQLVPRSVLLAFKRYKLNNLPKLKDRSAQLSFLRKLNLSAQLNILLKLNDLFTRLDILR